MTDLPMLVIHGAIVWKLAMIVLAAPVLRAACNDPAAPKVDWSGCSKERLILKDRDLQEAKFVRTILLGVNFASAKLSRANFSSAEINHASFRDALLDGATFEKAVAVRSNFSGARFDGANLEKAELHRSLLAKASLKNANLSKGELDVLRTMRGPLALFRRGEVLALMPFTFLR